MLKKTLAILLACVMVCTIVPMGAVQAFAAEIESATVAATEDTKAEPVAAAEGTEAEPVAATESAEAEPVAATESAEAEPVAEQDEDYETLAPGESKIADIPSGGEVIFKITPDKDEAYEFWSEANDLDTLAYLLDEDMYQLKRNDDGGESNNFKLQYELKGGQTYFLRVLMYGDNAGKFTVKAKTITSAKGVSIDKGDTISTFVNEYVYLNASFEPEDSFGGELSWSTSDPDVVEVFSYSTEGCKILARKTGKAVVTVETEKGLKDSIEVTVKEPEAIAESEVKSGSVEYYGQSFAYKFTPDESSRYKLAIDSDIQNYMVYLKGENGEYTIDSDTGTNSEYKVNLEGGKAYNLIIRVGDNHNEGSYSLSFEKTDYIRDFKITKLPDKTTYVDGYYGFDYLDFTGLELEATWSDGGVESLTYDDDSSNKFRDEYVSFSREDKTIKIRCAGAETSFEINTIPNPVKSIEVVKTPDLEFIEHTHGYWNTKYNPETDEYDLSYYYYNITGNYDGNNYDLNDVEVKINYNDGTSSIVGLKEKTDGYYFSIYENQYNNPWTVGDNKVEISYLGATASFNVRILESPVKDIELLEEPKPVIENSNGSWVTSYNYETGEDESFFYYDELNLSDIPVRIHFKDGTTEEGEIGRKLNDYYVSYTTSQYDKHYALGSDNEVVLDYMGFEKKINFTIIENPVKKIEILGKPKPIVENTNGYIEKEYNYETDEYEDFYYYRNLNIDDVPVRIYYKDGTTKDAEIGDTVDDNYWVKFSTDQYKKHFTRGSDNEVTVSYLGVEATLYITIIETPVKKIEILGKPKPVIENTNGYINDRFNEETGEYENYYYYSVNLYDVPVRIYYKDGTTKDAEIGDTVDDDYYITTSTDQNNKPFTLGSDNEVTVSYLGVNTTLYLTIIENPVESLTLLDDFKIKVYETVDGYTTSEYNPETGDYDLEYFRYNLKNIQEARVQVNYKNGTSKIIHPYEEINDEFGEFYVNAYSDQENRPWTLGGNNYATVSYMGAEVSVPAVVYPSPIKSIELVKPTAKKFIENTDGYETTDKNDNSFYYYRVRGIEDAEIKINLTDGTSRTANVGDSIGGYVVSSSTDQFSEPWKLGSDNYIMIRFMGKEVKMPVTVVENPVKSITIDSVPTKQYILGDAVYGLTRYFEPSDYRGLKFTVNFKDGTKKTYTGEEIDRNMLDGHDVTVEAENPPKVGQVPVTLTYMGAKAQYNVTVKNSDFASIEVIKLPTKPVYSDFYEPDWRGLQMKVTYKNGTSKIGTLKDGNIIYGYSDWYGMYVGFDFDGVIGILARRWIDEEEKYGYIISLGDVSGEIKGLTYREDKRVTDVDVENFSESAQNMLLKVTYQDGSKEDIRLTTILYNGFTMSKQTRSVKALTDKGVLSFSIPNHEVVQTDVILWVFEIAVRSKNPNPEPDPFPYPDIDPVPVVDRIIGDANGDGIVDILDATLIQKYAAEKVTLTDAQKDVADVNDDGVVDILDATDIQKYSAEKLTEFKKKA